MALIKEINPDDNIKLLLEYLANRLTNRHAVYFNGNGRCQLVLEGKIPAMWEFKQDTLADVIKRTIFLMEAAKKLVSDKSNTVALMQNDIDTLKLLIVDM